MPQFKELVDHLFFLVLYALPAMIDKKEYASEATLIYNAASVGAMMMSTMHKQI